VLQHSFNSTTPDLAVQQQTDDVQALYYSAYAHRNTPMRHILTLRHFIFFAIVLTQGACGSTGVPKGIEPVTNFTLEKYLGTWYEVARLDHKFERGLERVSATYSLRDDGTVNVLNKGYSTSSEKWKEASGRAKFVLDESTGYLKVSFFGPFYGSYIVFELDKDYQYALVSGPDRGYMWLLSRTPEIDKSRYESLLAIASDNGFDVSKLIVVKH